MKSRSTSAGQAPPPPPPPPPPPLGRAVSPARAVSPRGDLVRVRGEVRVEVRGRGRVRVGG